MTEQEIEKRIEWLDGQLETKKQLIENELHQLEGILQELIALRESLKQLFENKTIRKE